MLTISAPATKTKTSDLFPYIGNRKTVENAIESTKKIEGIVIIDNRQAGVAFVYFDDELLFRAYQRIDVWVILYNKRFYKR